MRTAAAAVGRPSNAAIRRRREEGLFWITRQILRANDDAQRASILLSIPDLVLVNRADELKEACGACQFADGVTFIDVRVAATCANRDEKGLLPADKAAQLERWRCGMAAIANASDLLREVAGRAEA